METQTFRRILSTAWTVLVGISAIFVGILWLALSVERMGAPTVLCFIVLAVLIRQRRSGEECD